MLKQTLLASHWLLAPMYVGLIATLAMLVVVFLREVAYYVPQAIVMTSETAIIAALTLIDLTLVANLLLIVIVSGYENLVSPSAPPERAEQSAGVGTVDFSGLKIKLIASIVAISGIELLKRFMTIGEGSTAQTMADPSLFWSAAIHLIFVISAVLLALMDWLSGKDSQKGA